MSYFKKASISLKNNLGIVMLLIISLLVFLTNFKLNYFIIGNDNFSPELNPGLTLKRSLLNPAWRSYRVLGIPSDSEQGDIFRTTLFYLLQTVLPSWLISQLYIFITFFIAVFSMGSITCWFSQFVAKKKHKQLFFFFGGLFYISNLLTIWVYFFPVHLFVAAFAFLPLVIWQIIKTVDHPKPINYLTLILSSLLLGTAALTATMFIIIALVIFIFGFLLLLLLKNKEKMVILIKAIILVFIVHLFWIVPFLFYVSSQKIDLQNSQINREITSETIANEQKYNTFLNIPRYAFSWLFTQEDGKNYTYPQFSWYIKSPLGTAISYIPLFLFVCGTIYLIKKRQKPLLVLSISYFFGWFLIKGVNPPFGIIFIWLQKYVPLFEQVFRWQSSKLWPLMLLPLPIVASIGTYGLLRLLKQKQQKAILGSFIALLLLINVFPILIGSLIRNSMYVQIPFQYQQLANYLKDTNPYGRIYIAPEANTQYFRNYDWGFWGSVVLNYVLPNPIIEKALIIGSDENEQAYTLLHNSYYSQDPELFDKALQQYNVSYVLSDKYISKGVVGYKYDWSLHNQMVEKNSGLVLLKSFGKLKLYQVLAKKEADEYLIVDTDHNWLRLNTILTKNSPNQTYVSSFDLPGTLYPLALNQKTITFDQNTIETNWRYTHKSQNFTWNIDYQELINSPTKVQYQNGRISLTPAWPTIKINKEPVDIQVPKMQLPQTTLIPKFITVNDQVIDLRKDQNKKVVLNTRFRDIYTDKNLSVWNGNSTQLDLLGAWQLQVSEPTILELEATFEVPQKANFSVCVWSDLQQRCLNKPNQFAALKGSNSFTLLIPKIITSREVIKMYIKPKDTQISNFTYKRLQANVYTNSEEISDLNISKIPSVQTYNFALHQGDQISMSLPMIQGSENYHYPESNSQFTPETSIEYFDNKEETSDINTKNNTIMMVSQEANTSIYQLINQIHSEGKIALIGASGTNVQSIPYELKLRQPEQEFNLYKRMANRHESDAFLDFVIIPTVQNQYYTEILAKGIGAQPSINQINNWFFQMIPVTWANIHIKPDITMISSQHICTLNQAVSPYWLTIGKNQQPVRVNGWEQGWIVDSQEDVEKVFYWPNIFSYLGYGLIVVLGLGLISQAWLVNVAKRADKTE
ncbi:hypothetical protein GYA49_06320 [Candidatus Beckwithbacteria bacterium]|nr:hypothetical protein [Candidatus Beckwithbacteria bacterium]